MLTPLQLPSVHIIPPVMECARDNQEQKANAKREFYQRKVAKERLSVISTFRIR